MVTKIDKFLTSQSPGRRDRGETHTHTSEYTAVPPYPQRIRSKTLQQCPKLSVVLNPIYTVLFPLHTGGTRPKSQNVFIKNCVFILTCLNFSPLQSTLHLMQCTYQDSFSTAQNCVWTHWFWCLLPPLLFLFHLFHICKTFPYEDFFHPGNKKSHLGRDQVNKGGWGLRVMPFWVQNCWTFSAMWAGALVIHLLWNGQMSW